jgi:low affinity Fe/Cu permease
MQMPTTRKDGQPRASRNGPRAAKKRVSRAFEIFAAATARIAGRPYVFFAAVTIVLVWAATGPLVGFSDTWQLVINTSTTIITFLMVFLIQHTQNRDTLALQIKVAELLVALKGADGDLATAEDLSEESLEQLHERFRTAVHTSREAPRRAARSKRKPAR